MSARARRGGTYAHAALDRSAAQDRSLAVEGVVQKRQHLLDALRTLIGSHRKSAIDGKQQ
jgi:hypothetical protein